MCTCVDCQSTRVVSFHLLHTALHVAACTAVLCLLTKASRNHRTALKAKHDLSEHACLQSVYCEICFHCSNRFVCLHDGILNTFGLLISIIHIVLMVFSKVVWLCTAEPFRRFGAENAQQDGQGACQVPGEAAWYATKQQTLFAHVDQPCLWHAF